jgi:hypothetical protein
MNSILGVPGDATGKEILSPKTSNNLASDLIMDEPQIDHKENNTTNRNNNNNDNDDDDEDDDDPDINFEVRAVKLNSADQSTDDVFGNVYSEKKLTKLSNEDEETKNSSSNSEKGTEN